MSHAGEQAEDCAQQSEFIRAAVEARDARFRKLHADGLATWQLAERLGMTTGGVYKAYDRLGLAANQEEE